MELPLDRRLGKAAHTQSVFDVRDCLAKEAIAGDRGALVRLIELVQPDIRRFARTQCQAGDAEDAVQEALFQPYRRVGKLRAAGALTAWFVVLRDFEEMTIDEIGLALDLSREAVKGRLRRARALLREYLLDY